MAISSNKKSNHTPEIIVITGYFVLICLVAILFGGFYYVADKATAQPTPTQDPILATLLAPTPTPHIPVDYQAGINTIFKDDFKDNQNNWHNNEEPTDITVKDGRLSFGSLSPGNYATARSAYLFSPNSFQPYYIQADLSLDEMTDKGIGIIFRSTYGDDFFLFEINPEFKTVFPVSLWRALVNAHGRHF